MAKRVLSIGKNKGVLRKLTRALIDAGFEAEWTDETAEASRRAGARDIDLVAFGRGVDGPDREALREAFAAANRRVLFVDGLAPMIPLLVAQVEDAFSSRLGSGRLIEAVEAARRGAEDEVTFTVREACEIEVTEYRLDWLYRTHIERHYRQYVPDGTRSIRVRHRRGTRFAVVRADGNEVSILRL